VTRKICVVALFVSVAGGQPAFADVCGDTVRDYNTVLSRLTDAVEQFSTCVADSKGMNDCAKPFTQLRSIYNQFTSVVSIYSTQCETKR
jgi:hypothetical protein